MEYQEEESDYSSVIDNLVNMFGHIVTKEVIATLVESCEGDLNLSMDAIMKITNDEDTTSKENDASDETSEPVQALPQPPLPPQVLRQQTSQQEPRQHTPKQQTPPQQEPRQQTPKQQTPQQQGPRRFSPPNPATQHQPPPQQAQPPQQTGPPISYAGQASQSRGAIPKQTIKQPVKTSLKWTEQIRTIISHHNNGTRMMILMRGLAGSGKSHLAKSLIESMIGPSFNNYVRHIMSADDYFTVRAQYQFDKSRLSHAHVWNQERVRLASYQGLSPIIVDNTNIEEWEMQPYVAAGVENGYIIEVVEPTTSWAKNANQLFKRNTHNVPLHTIKRKLGDYREGITGESLRRSLMLNYSADKVPPVKRLIPPIDKEQPITTRPEPSPSIQSMIQNTSLINTQPLNTTQQSSQTPPSSVVNQSIHQDNIREIEAASFNFAQAKQPVESNDKNDNVARSLACIREKQQKEYNLNKTKQEGCSQEEKDSQQQQQELPPPPPPEQQQQQRFFLINEANEDVTREDQDKLKVLMEAQKRLEELEKFEAEWENGEEWNESDQAQATARSVNPSSNTPASLTTSSTPYMSAENPADLLIKKLTSKPPRKERNLLVIDSEPKDSLMKSVNECQDWRDISLFLPPWDVPDVRSNISRVQKVPIQTTTSSTCVEAGDTNVTGYFKVISGISRDINEYFVAPASEKIPEKRMFDKSTMTMNSDSLTVTVKCPQAERHFIAIRKLFSHIERTSLRDIFDNCCGDANWAVENILAERTGYQLKDKENDKDSDLDEELDMGSDLPCTCLAKYDLIPNDTSTVSSSATHNNLSQTAEVVSENKSDVVTIPERKKRDTPMSNENMQLKKQIEQNVRISDSHYSEHCLKIRKMRRGERNHENNLEQPSTSGTQTATSETTSGKDLSNAAVASSNWSDDENTSSSDVSECSKIVNVNVGSVFIKELDQMFGRHDMEYPKDVKFNISVPSSLLAEINAYWIESMMFQLDEIANKSLEMVKQDEEFARQIAMKEAELLQDGKEPAVPDLKEIMDLEFSLSVHMKDCSGWKNNVPNDMATKMTHDKLYNLFPEINKDTLLELLTAHGHNFKTTVEVLLTTMGRNDILEKEHGLNKFVMEKELARQEKVLEEQKQVLSKEDWPPIPSDEVIEMSTVQQYRDEAENHLNRRQMNMHKAEDYMRRGMTQVANYYSELANYNKRMFEKANGWAVASLMQYHANNSADSETVDLHYFRVKEAMEALDLFIDLHIRKLKEANKSSVMLFFITGRGLHSQGRPRIKPACVKRLRERGMRHSECNPGLLRARVSSTDKLTYQVP